MVLAPGMYMYGFREIRFVCFINLPEESCWILMMPIVPVWPKLKLGGSVIAIPYSLATNAYSGAPLGVTARVKLPGALGRFTGFCLTLTPSKAHESKSLT